mgnify:FL=1
MREALGCIHRHTNVEPAFNRHEKEYVVLLRATHRVPGTTSHNTTSLSIEAAVALYQQLGDVLTDVMWDDTREAHLED